MRGTPSPVHPLSPAALHGAADVVDGPESPAPASPRTTRAQHPARHRVSRARRTGTARRLGTGALATAVLTGLVAGLVTALAAAPALASAGLPEPVAPGTVLPAPADPGLPGTGGGGAAPLDTIEDEEAWCSYLSSSYLAFPSPWSARVYNCRHTSMFVAPVFSNGTVGMCVLVPARHSRHLGGNVTKWVTDIRVC